jgi:hypothetical protein
MRRVGSRDVVVDTRSVGASTGYELQPASGGGSGSNSGCRGSTLNAHALWGLVVMRVVTNPQLETLSTLPSGNPTCRSLENTTQTIHSVARTACATV